MTDAHNDALKSRFAFYRNGPGFGIGDGWFQIIWYLSEKIEAILTRLDEGIETTHRTKESKVKPSDAFRVLQVKEKFGTLRYYTNGITDEIGAAVQFAEMSSRVTCEDCGKPGVLRGNTWLFTACNEHAKGEPAIENEDP